MRIALIRQRYNPYGGAERFVERLAASLAGPATDLTLITRAWPDGATTPHTISVCAPFHVGRWWRDASFCRCAQAAIATGGFDLVQSHERIPGCDIYRAGDGVHATWLELRGRLQSPLARRLTALHPWHRYTLRAEAAMFRHPRLRAVICNSRLVRDDIARRFGLRNDVFEVIYNGVDLDTFHPGLRSEHRERVRHELAIPPAATLVAFVGSGFERKGLAALIAAVARQPGLHLVVVGRDKREAAMRSLATRAGVANRVRFVGGQKDVRPFLGAADGFVLPTVYDPFPNAAMEALACGLPVVVSTTCGAAELVEEGRNGFLCDAFSADSLDAALARLAQAKGLAAMADAARATAQRHPQAAMAAQLERLYRRLAGLDGRTVRAE